MSDLALLLVGIVVAAAGGEAFVRGAVGVSRALRVPAGIIGATVAAFATSAPEMAVGVNAAIAGTPAVAAGDALGSNVANIGLVLGIALAFGAIRVDRRDIRRDLPLAAAAPLALGLLSWDGRLSRIDAAVLLTVFAAWVVSAVLQAMRERDAAGEALGATPGRAAWLALSGLALLVIAGRLVVVAAGSIGARLGIDPFVVGATLVAFGTSVPELATTVIARLRGIDELGVGTVIGSNVFNTLWIVGLVALIRPFDLAAGEVRLAVIAGALAALLLIPGPSWTLGRSRAVPLLALYAGYAALIVRAHV